MHFKTFVFSVGLVAVGIVLYKYLKVDLIEQCESDKCPYCYGTDLCELFQTNKITLSEDTLAKFFTNRFSVKNVFYAKLHDENIILKKFAHAEELEEFDNTICTSNSLEKGCNLSSITDSHNYAEAILEVLTTTRSDHVNNFKICSESSAAAFIQEITSYPTKSSTEENLKHIWTSLKLSAEPLLLKVLLNGDSSRWPVPEYFGACGRLTAQSYRGAPLNSYETAAWLKRADLAYQLLTAAKNFTFDHAKFRFYLTDVSPDNIVVDDNFKLSFIDLDNVVLSLKTEGSAVHHSSHYGEETLFAYSEDEICSSTVSDHNFYTVCKLLLSRDAPWPMMKGGLLHSAPPDVVTHSGRLFDCVELCVKPKDNLTRFIIVKELLEIFENILYGHGF